VFRTKDFNNPRVEVRLYYRFLAHPSGGDTSADYTGFSDMMAKMGMRFFMPHSSIPYGLRRYYKKGLGAYSYDKEGLTLLKEVYSRGEINIVQIEALQSTLTQMLTAQQQSELAATVSHPISTADELLKFKSLLDSGIISQAEFDAKKRQLLEL